MLEIDKKLALSKKVFGRVKKIVSTLEEAGHECYIVGGSVRDMLLGVEAYDIDFATSARPEVVLKLFRHAVPTGIKHGTVTVLIDREPFELTTYRSDGKYIDGRRPDSVFFSDSLKEDIVRRDFTINGLAYSLAEEKVIDYVEGTRDLGHKVIRTIGDPHTRLSEDGLRAYRACRFAAKLGFEIEEATLVAIKDTNDISAKVSVERVRDELMKMMGTAKPSVGIDYMRKTGLLKLALPELDAAYGVEQNRFHSYDVYHHCVYSCDAAPADKPLIRFATLLHDVGKVRCRAKGADGDYTFYNHEVVGARMTRSIMKRLKFSNDEIEHAVNLVYNHMFYYTDEWTDGAVRRFIRKVGLDNLQDLLAMREADRVGNGSRQGLAQPIYELQKRIAQIIEKDNAFSVKDLNINGNQLMKECALRPGPVIGEVLNYLLDEVLEEPKLNEYESLLEKAKEFLESE